jgi:class 3 adenylate cyclase/ankyrin repeat protein
MTSTRRLAAILAADVAGYSRLMGADEEGTHERLMGHLRDLVDPKIREHRGRIVKNTGDGMLAEFPSVVDAVRCAAEMQRAMADRNAETVEDKRVTFRIGINLGDVIAEKDDIYGDGVNVAARLEALAEPGGICISRVVRDQIRDKLPYPFEDKGEQSVKNIARSVRVFALRPEAVAELPPTSVIAPVPRRSRLVPVAIATATATALVIAVITWWIWPTTSSSRSPPAAIGTAGGSAPPTQSALRPTVPVFPPQQIALWNAVVSGNVTDAIASIKAGADVNGLDTRNDVNGRRPLDYAAKRNDKAMIAALLDAGANINLSNRLGFTPLHHAAMAGSSEAAALLVAKGANLFLRNTYEQTPEQTAMAFRHPVIGEFLLQQQQFALWDAVALGNVTAAIASIKAGADVNGLDTRPNANGRRPLDYAAANNDTAMIRALLDAGANINLPNLSGFTPLHHAGEAGSKEAATLLIAKGANLCLRNTYEQTPEQTATALHHSDVAGILSQAMTCPK